MAKATKKTAKKVVKNKYPDGKKIAPFCEMFSPNLTKDQFATLVGSCRQQVYKWENGLECPTRKNIDRINFLIDG